MVFFSYNLFCMCMWIENAVRPWKMLSGNIKKKKYVYRYIYIYLLWIITKTCWFLLYYFINIIIIFIFNTSKVMSSSIICDYYFLFTVIYSKLNFWKYNKNKSLFILILIIIVFFDLFSSKLGYIVLEVTTKNH